MPNLIDLGLHCGCRIPTPAQTLTYMLQIGQVQVVPVGILAQVVKAKSLFQAKCDSTAWEWDHTAASMLLVYSSANRATVVEAVQLSTPLSIGNPNATTTYVSFHSIWIER